MDARGGSGGSPGRMQPIDSRAGPRPVPPAGVGSGESGLSGRQIKLTGGGTEYEGALFRRTPRAGGTGEWGSETITWAVAGEKGGVAVTCFAAHRAGQRGEDGASQKALQAYTDQSCPGLLDQVSVSGLGRAVPLRR